LVFLFFYFFIIIGVLGLAGSLKAQNKISFCTYLNSLHCCENSYNVSHEIWRS